MALPRKDLLFTWELSGGSGSVKRVYLLNAVLPGIQQTYYGVRTTHTYTIIGGELKESPS